MNRNKFLALSSSAVVAATSIPAIALPNELPLWSNSTFDDLEEFSKYIRRNTTIGKHYPLIFDYTNDPTIRILSNMDSDGVVSGLIPFIRKMPSKKYVVLKKIKIEFAGTKHISDLPALPISLQSMMLMEKRYLEFFHNRDHEGYILYRPRLNLMTFFSYSPDTAMVIKRLRAQGKIA